MDALLWKPEDSEKEGEREGDAASWRTSADGLLDMEGGGAAATTSSTANPLAPDEEAGGSSWGAPLAPPTLGAPEPMHMSFGEAPPADAPELPPLEALGEALGKSKEELLELSEEDLLGLMAEKRIGIVLKNKALEALAEERGPAEAGGAAAGGGGGGGAADVERVRNELEAARPAHERRQRWFASSGPAVHRLLMAAGAACMWLVMLSISEDLIDCANERAEERWFDIDCHDDDNDDDHAGASRAACNSDGCCAEAEGSATCAAGWVATNTWPLDSSGWGGCPNYACVRQCLRHPSECYPSVRDYAARTSALRVHGPFGRDADGTKTWANLPAHSTLTLKLRYFAGSTWDHERGKVWVDGQEVWRSSENDQGKCERGDGGEMEGWVRYVGQPYASDKQCYVDVSVVLQHHSATLRLRVGSTLDQGVDDER